MSLPVATPAATHARLLAASVERGSVAVLQLLPSCCWPLHSAQKRCRQRLVGVLAAARPFHGDPIVSRVIAPMAAPQVAPKVVAGPQLCFDP